MKKILINESEKRQILNQHKKAGYTISEQQESVVDVNNILNVLKQNVQTPGTNEKRLLFAIKNLKTIQDIQKLESLISTSKGMRNLKSLSDVINFELDMSDYQDTQTRKQIWSHLNSIDKSYRLQPDEKSGQKLVKVSSKNVDKETPKNGEQKWVPSPNENEVKSGKKMVKKGMKGDVVLKIQEQLKLRGYKINPDSIYGNDTYNTVKKFQQDSKLKSVDGIVGPETYNKLFTTIKVGNKINPESSVPSPTKGMTPLNM